jgi:hypothetical protein
MEAPLKTKGRPEAALPRRSKDPIVSKKRLAELADLLQQNFIQRQRDLTEELCAENPPSAIAKNSYKGRATRGPPLLAGLTNYWDQYIMEKITDVQKGFIAIKKEARGTTKEFGATKKEQKKRLGRPPSGGPETPVQVRLEAPLLEAIDRAIATDGRGLSRPTAIRDLVADALASLGILPVSKSATHHQP